MTIKKMNLIVMFCLTSMVFCETIAVFNCSAFAAEIPTNRAEAEQMLKQGWELRRQGKFGEAIQILEQVYNYDPDLRVEWQELPVDKKSPIKQYVLIAEVSLGRAYFQQGRATGDIKSLNRAEQLQQSILRKDPDADATMIELQLCRELLSRAGTELKPLAFVNRKYVNWKISPEIRENHILLPAKGLAQSLNLRMERTEDGREVRFVSKEMDIRLIAESRKARLDNEEKSLDTAPIVSGDEILVPLRFVAEYFGAKVKWDPLAKIAWVS